MSLTVDELAKEIGRIYEGDGAWCRMVATGLLPFIQRHIAAGQQGATNPAAEAIQYHSAAGPIDAMAAAFSAMDNSDTALEEWPQRAIDALAFAGWAVVPYALPYEVLGEAGISGVFETGNPKHGWDWLVAKTRIGPHGPPAATPQPPKPAGAVPLPVMEVLDRREVTPVCDHVVMGYTQAQLVEYGDAREAAGRAGAVPAHRVADLLHLLQFATITTPTHGDDEQAKKVMAELSDLLAAPIPQQPAAEPAAVNQSLTTEGAEAVYQYQTVTNGWHDLLDAADSEKYKAAGWPVRTLYTRPTPAADAGGVTEALRPAGFNESAHVTVMTYTSQPGNVEAWCLGEARAKSAPGGDYIDGGLSLLRELHARGYGIVRVPPLAALTPEVRHA